MPKLPTAEQLKGQSIYSKPVKTLKVPMVSLIRIQALLNNRIDVLENLLKKDITLRSRNKIERQLTMLHTDLKAICGGN